MHIDSEITFRKLEILLSFIENKTLASTASELNISTVSVHKALHSLENALCCPLFKKEGRILKPLPSAIILANYGKTIIRNMQQAINLSREAVGFSSDRFVLGSIYSLTVKTIPKLIMGLKIRKSDLNIDLKLGSNNDLLHQLRNMEVDSILVSTNNIQKSSDLEIFNIFSDEIFLVTSNNSPFSNRESISLYELKDSSFITLTKGFATYEDGNKLFNKAGFTPNIIIQVNDIFTLLNMISSEMGYGLLPGRVASVYENKVNVIKLSFPESIKQNIGLVFLKNRERNPNVLSMLAECRMYKKANF